MTWFVKTEKRSYNSVNSPEHFKQVRKNLNDFSKVIELFISVRGLGWVKVDKLEFNYFEAELMRCEHCGKRQTVSNYCVQNEKGQCERWGLNAVYDGKKLEKVIV